MGLSGVLLFSGVFWLSPGVDARRVPICLVLFGFTAFGGGRDDRRGDRPPLP